MNLANWTTRLLGDSAPASDDSQREEPALGAAPPSLVGSRVGAYLITKRLGAGGVGEVFKGVDEMLKREVAIKVLRDELASDPIFLKRFSNEARLLAKLSHPNVASVHAFLHEGDKQLMVMEYVAGIGLDEFVRAGGPVPTERALSIFRRALDGIEHAHANGIVHRDIKPANIMLADSGQVKVMDFGIARALDCQENLTRHGQVAGTAKAMSPEQIRGQKADVRSDIYSLGIVLYTLLAGRPPFEDASDHALMMAQLEQAPPPLRGLVGNLPSKVEAAVMRALEKDPSARFQTVREFARAIDACLADLAPAAKPVANRPLDSAATASRTAINPALQGVRHLPVGSGRAAASAPARAAGPRWVRVGAVSAAVLALVGGGALLWTQRLSLDTPDNALTPPPALTPQTSVSQAPSGEPPLPAPAAQAAPAAAPEPAAAARSAASAPLMQAPTTTAPPPVSPPPVIESAPLRKLAIVRMGAGAKAATAAATEGEQFFRAGERIRLLVKPSDDSHVYCYLQDEARRILRFYPNRFHKSALVKAGSPQEIPGKMRFELVANSLGVTETIACFASARDLMAELPPAVAGPDLTPLPVASLEDVKSAFERLSGDSLAEASLRVQIK